MHKKAVVVVSDVSSGLPDRPTKRVLLSRETIRVLSAEDLSHVAGGCPSPSQETKDPDVI